MQRFKKILIAVDLSEQDRLVSAELPPPTAEAVERALWIAKLNSSELTFFYALDVSAAAQRLIEESDENDPDVMSDAKDVLGGLVARATSEGITAHMEVRIGKSWLEIIRRVLRHDHDLVIAGTRHMGMLKGFIMGSTGLKLLRKCPCAVWITQPQRQARIRSILVAHCLREVGDVAMELGCSMAQLHGAQLHVLHSLELAELDSALPARVPAETMAEFRSNAERHINGQLAKFEFAQSPQVHVVTDAPDLAVLHHIQRHGVDLVVMGTVARTGIPGFIIGNTAELLLPQVRCSVLAVKPPGFVSPVSI